jgi:hypothetical protein
LDEIAETGEVEIPTFVVLECGLRNDQVWPAILDDLSRDRSVNRQDMKNWLDDSRLLGRGENGAIVIGLQTPAARRKINERLFRPLERSARSVIADGINVELVVTREWLAQQDAD